VHTTLSFDMVGEDVLITGAGPIGCMAIAVARHAGARKVVITDINDGRLELAKKFGPTRTVNTAKENLSDVWHKELGMTEGFDVGLEMSGSAIALNQMIDNMIMGGRIALLGTHSAKAEVDWNKIVFKMLHLKGIYGREMFETWYKMTALVQGGNGHHARHHPPDAGRPIPGRLRPHGRRQVRQDRPELGVADAGGGPVS